MVLKYFKRDAFSLYLLGIFVGLFVLVSAVFIFDLPARITLGEKGQKAIKMLDSMRRPFLMIKEAEVRVREGMDTASAYDEFLKANQLAETLITHYRSLAGYNPKLLRNVMNLK